MSATAQTPPRVSATARRTMWRAVENRGRLAGLELVEARGRLFAAWWGSTVVLLGIQLVLAAGLIALVAATWDTDWRVAAPAMAGGVLAVVTLVTGMVAWKRWQAWAPFAETQRQLAQDLELIKAEFAAANDTVGEDASSTDEQASPGGNPYGV